MIHRKLNKIELLFYRVKNRKNKLELSNLFGFVLHKSIVKHHKTKYCEEKTFYQTLETGIRVELTFYLV